MPVRSIYALPLAINDSITLSDGIVFGLNQPPAKIHIVVLFFADIPFAENADAVRFHEHGIYN